MIGEVIIMAAKRDFYEVLGIDKNADEATIKKAYRKLAKKYHPDMNKGNPNAEKIFQEVTEAYEVLGDPKKRKLYDEYGPISLEAGFDPEKMKQAQYGNPFGNGGFYQSYSSGGPGSGYQEFHFDGSSDMDDILDKLFGKKGAAEMTKNPLALASALRKISADPDIEAVKREDVAQLFIEHPGKQAKSGFNGLSGLFATHPPIQKRIEVLEQF